MRCPTRLFDKSSSLEGSISRVEAVEVAFLQARVLPPVPRGLVFLRALRRIPPVSRYGSLRFPRNSGRTTIPGAEPRISLRSFRRAFFEAHPGPSSVLVDEFDARGFQGLAQPKDRDHRGRELTFQRFDDVEHSDIGAVEVSLAPHEGARPSLVLQRVTLPSVSPTVVVGQFCPADRSPAQRAP